MKAARRAYLLHVNQLVRNNCIEFAYEIDAVGYKAVHDGTISSTVIVNDEVIKHNRG